MPDMLGNVIVMGVDVLHHAGFDHMHNWFSIFLYYLIGEAATTISHVSWFSISKSTLSI